ncbi:hypothetical protein ABPG72_021788 [Tetrahymena utriculariae]
MKQQGQQQQKVQNNRQNYHQQQKNETGSDSSNSIRRYSLSSTWSSSNSRTNSKKNRSVSRSNSSKRNTHNQIKKVHNRIKTPQNNNKKGVCKFWMKGTCNNFDSCKNKHFQQTTLSFRKKHTLNQNQTINQALLKENKILVTTITQKLLDSQQLIELITQDYDGINQTIKISHKNNKQLKKMKKLLYNNSKNEYINKTQRENEQLLTIQKFIPILIKDVKDENSHKIIIAKQKRLEKRKLYQQQKKNINSEKIQIIREENEEIEESQQNTKLNSTQQRSSDIIKLKPNPISTIEPIQSPSQMFCNSKFLHALQYIF